VPATYTVVGEAAIAQTPLFALGFQLVSAPVDVENEAMRLRAVPSILVKSPPT
jgi:hypothetical protein